MSKIFFVAISMIDPAVVELINHETARQIRNRS
jgi:hypothetical protein